MFVISRSQALMATLAPSRPVASLVARSPTRKALRRAISTFATAQSAGESSPAPAPLQKNRLVMYSKPGCCLCDGLKEKLHTALCLGGPHSLQSVDLQVRDISGNPEWERLYQYEIPVLARILPDGTEETLPRFSPRLAVELIQKKLATALEL